MSLPLRKVRKARMTSATWPPLLDQFLVGALGFLVPLPGVLEGLDLGTGAGAVLFGEEDVVVLAGVEGRVEVDEVHGLVLDVAAEDVKVIAVVEVVFEHRWREM